MKTYTIKQKMSNSGSIYDLASDMYDREINFPSGSVYAVVTASYYGGKGYTTHRSGSAAIKASRALGDYSHKIIDADGNIYDVDVDWDLLVPRLF